jgi:hypothetical protein
MDIKNRIKKTKVGKPTKIELSADVNIAYYRNAAHRLNSEVNGSDKPMYSIHVDGYHHQLIIIKNY